MKNKLKKASRTNARDVDAKQLAWASIVGGHVPNTFL